MQPTFASSLKTWFLTAAAVLVVVGLTACFNIRDFERWGRADQQSHAACDLAGDITSNLRYIQSSQRGYLLTGRPAYLLSFQATMETLLRNVSDLRVAVGRERVEQDRVDDLDRNLQMTMGEIQRTVDLVQQGHRPLAMKIFLANPEYAWTKRIHEITSAIANDETQSWQQIGVERRSLALRTVFIIILGVTVNLVILYMVSAIVGREISNRKQAEGALRDANVEISATHSELQRRVGELEQLNGEMALVAELGELLQTCRAHDEAYTVISKSLRQLFPGGAGALFMLSPSKNLLETVAHWGEGVCPEAVFSPDDCWALRRSRTHLVYNLEADLVCHHIHQETTEGYICIPLMADREALGVLTLIQPKGGNATRPDVRLARTVADHICLAISNLRLQETLRGQSIRDPLTGLFNRRYLEVSLEREMLRAMRGHNSVGAVMMDIDHFKHFNDTYGHDAGDTLLREVGRCLQEHIRGGDIACRFGGEEFILIFPEASLEDTICRAEAIRETVKHLDVTHRGQHLDSVTLSLGVAAFPEHGDTADGIVHSADEALYRAKRAGRDQVMCATY